MSYSWPSSPIFNLQSTCAMCQPASSSANFEPHRSSAAALAFEFSMRGTGDVGQLGDGVSRFISMYAEPRDHPARGMKNSCKEGGLLLRARERRREKGRASWTQRDRDHRKVREENARGSNSRGERRASLSLA